jgi:hypothetical protein
MANTETVQAFRHNPVDISPAHGADLQAGSHIVADCRIEEEGFLEYHGNLSPISHQTVAGRNGVSLEEQDTPAPGQKTCKDK